MEDLHAAIEAYLRGQRRLPDAELARQLFGYREGRYPAPRCLVCGRPVTTTAGCSTSPTCSTGDSAPSTTVLSDGGTRLC